MVELQAMSINIDCIDYVTGIGNSIQSARALCVSGKLRMRNYCIAAEWSVGSCISLFSGMVEASTVLVDVPGESRDSPNAVALIVN